MIKTLVVPVIPNSPLKKKNQRTANGKILLRYNKKIDMIENGYFRHELIKYDQNYSLDLSFIKKISNKLNLILSKSSKYCKSISFLYNY